MSQAAKDFSHRNLRGKNFKGLDLTGANFSYADIRGANFSNAILRGANFTEAVAGLNQRWIGLIAISLLTLFIGIFVVGFAFIQGGWLYPSNLEMNLFAVVVFIVVCIIVLFWGLEAMLAALGSIIALALFIMGATALSGGIVIPFTLVIVLPIVTSLLGVGALTILATLVSVELGNLFGILVAVGYGSILISGAWIGALFGNPPQSVGVPRSIAIGLISVWVVLQTLLGSYVSWRIMVKDQRFSLILKLIIALSTIGGTSFRNSDLTDANFTQAKLKSTDFRDAKITQTHWLSAQSLDWIYFRNTYLQYPKIQKLITTLQGQGEILDGLALEGINLQGANLQDTSFIGTNLNNANLQDADLARAKLKQTQLDAANLAGATLTGAYIEDWGITTETKLDRVSCDYVYMRVPTKDDPDPIRKPDNRNEIFEDGDFADFIRPLTDTLDLYHNQGVDPRAIAISFKTLAESNPDAELRIVALEAKGEGKFLLRAKTSEIADKSELSAEYFSTYNQIKGLPEAQVRGILAEKDSRIQSLEAMVVTALQRPSFYSHVERADMVSNNPGGISQNVSGGNVYGGMQAAQGNNNTQSQEIHSIASSEQGLTQDQVIRLLAELESVLKQPELPGEVQTKAIRYLEAAKEEVQAKEPDKQLAAGNLKRMAETIETTSKTVESSKKIWDGTKPVLEAVLPWLGVAKSFFGF